jgi:hypothetical protein
MQSSVKIQQDGDLAALVGVAISPAPWLGSIVDQEGQRHNLTTSTAPHVNASNRPSDSFPEYRTSQVLFSRILQGLGRA